MGRRMNCYVSDYRMQLSEPGANAQHRRVAPGEAAVKLQSEHRNSVHRMAQTSLRIYARSLDSIATVPCPTGNHDQFK